MSTEDNKRLARRVFEEIWNQGSLDAVDAIYDRNQVSYGLGIEVAAGSAGIRQFAVIYRTAYPDIHFTIEDQVAEGDRVATRWSGIGTHTGELMGIPATGKRVTVPGMTINRIANGMIVETWNNFDALGQLQQLGVIPAPGQSQ